MATPLNLTLTRGPSIWEEQPRRPSDWRVYGAFAGACLAAFALQSRTSRHWIFGLGIGIAATSLLAGRFSSAVQAGARQLGVGRSAQEDRLVDRASRDS